VHKLEIRGTHPSNGSLVGQTKTKRERAGEILGVALDPVKKNGKTSTRERNFSKRRNCEARKGHVARDRKS